MKAIKIITFLFLIFSIGMIAYGSLSASEDREKFIGAGVVVLFFLVFPLFSYYRWKDRDLKDYMLTKENLDKMRENQKQEKY